MAQKTNLNVSPYFDDFVTSAKEKNYYKVLFNPGKPVQARELNTLQSILQDQIETFGSHVFKEGSVVIPGNIVYDDHFNSIKLNPQQYGVDVASYLEEFVGKKITGQISGVTATIQYVQLPNSEVEYPTIYVKYLDSDVNFEINPFQDNEPLVASETVGNVSSGTPFASTILADASSIGSSASIGDGVYFIRGTFARVSKQTIILDYYDNKPSYRVGLKVDERIITYKDDTSLCDNANGFSNYAAPGADRFEISLTLTKKLLTDLNDTDFIELLRVENGSVRKMQTETNYSLIKDYIASRTYDESGNYVVTPFQFSFSNSLNDRLGNDGLFFSNQKTSQGNTPSDDLMSLKLSPGKAYVSGYDVTKTGVEIIDVPKTRTTATTLSVNIPFEMGNLIKVNNVSGSPKQRGVIYLQNRRKTDSTNPAGTTIGSARVYTFNLTDAAYSGASTSWDLYLYDVQTYTEITLNQTVTTLEVPKSTFIKGKSSGASGYVVNDANGASTIVLSQTSGTFSVGEQILINGIEIPSRSIVSIKVYGINEIKSVYQPTSISGFTTAFISDSVLESISRPEIINISSSGAGTISTATTPSPATFSGIREDDIIKYNSPNATNEVYNRVVSISSDLTAITLEAVNNVVGVCTGLLPTSNLTNLRYTIGIPKISNDQKAFLYAQIPHQNISSVDLSSSSLTFSAQTNVGFNPTISSNNLTINSSNFNLGINSTTAKFENFDEERYSIFYSDGTVEKITSDKFVLDSNSNQVTFSNISNKTVSLINATFVKNGIQSKNKIFNRSKIFNVTFSKNQQSGTGISTSVNDGLKYNRFYGLRVQDEEICLNHPDVVKIIAVYESLDTNEPILDKLSFNSGVAVDVNAIVGENIIGTNSHCVARVVRASSSDTLEIVYLNNNRFFVGEEVFFEESSIKTQILSVALGKYSNITNKFNLDKGQKDQYYDYSKIVRKNGELEPSKQLLIIFDHYITSSSDSGDVFTSNSYTKDRFSQDIPIIGTRNVRATDTLDFRPVVIPFNSITKSPFDFDSRSFGTEPKLILSPNESSLIGCSYYLGRIDKLYLDRFGNFSVNLGVPSITPKPPGNPSEVMEIATVTIPPYLYDIGQILISLTDNKRYTMRDIGNIETRVENLERLTSLTLLETNTKNLQIKDGEGFDMFKSGFFVDDFKNGDLNNRDLTTAEIENDELSVQTIKNSIPLKLVSEQNVSEESLDLTSNIPLLDPNVQKTGDVVTLKYDSVGWIQQPFATGRENVNPFQVTSYVGTIKLNPENDSWVRQILLPEVTKTETITDPSLKFVPGYHYTGYYGILPGYLAPPSIERDARNRLYYSYSYLQQYSSPNNGTFYRWHRIAAALKSETTTSRTSETIRRGEELYMRSRNTGFTASNLKPLTRYYQFLDGVSGVDFIPKLVEISSDSTLQTYGASSAFIVGETVTGFFNGKRIIRFRVAKSNHKVGPYNNPTVTYTTNPYVANELIPEFYSSSSKTLNIDIESLSNEVQTLYSGYLMVGMRLVGSVSKSVAYVKDLKLVSDSNGFLSGSFFLRNPNTNPAPTVRIETGTKVFKLTSSSENQIQLPGDSLISSAEELYRSQGTWEEVRNVVTTTNTLTRCRRPWRRDDPLAQSFYVGRTSEPIENVDPGEDANGAYLTAIDLFFANKDSGNAPVTVEIRTVEFGTPTETVVGSPVTLLPEDVNVSSDATVPTKVTFDYPIYLAPNLSYAIVILAPQSIEYEVWIAQMNDTTIETKNLPDTQTIKYSRQFSIGRLYKSQNGAEWTPSDLQDLKFKLYKAKFTSTSGSVFFNNPSLDSGDGYTPTLKSNAITIYPRTLKVGITTTTNTTNIGILTSGVKISSQGKLYTYGYIVGTGSSVSNVGIFTGGLNYANGIVDTYNITGSGNGLKLSITTNSGTISVANVNSPGTGYRVGDIVGIVTSTVSNSTGRDAIISIQSISGLDTLYLTNVQGDSIDSSTLVYYDSNNTAQTLSGISVLSSVPVGSFYSGNYFRVDHFNHGMYYNTNKVRLKDISSDVPYTFLTSPLGATGDSVISIASTQNFSTFEGVNVSNTNPGFIKIGDEIIKYSSIPTSGTISNIERGIDSTISLDYPTNTPVYKYELGGVSLRRINKVHDISDIGIDIDSYSIEIDRSNFDSNVTNRSSDVGSSPQLSFNRQSNCGGDDINATQNIQFEAISPKFSIINPNSFTKVSAQIRTVSGTSVNGNEPSFIDQQYQPVELGKVTKLSSTRIVCSSINEDSYLTSLPRNKSFTLKVDLETSVNNLSPMIFWKESSAVLLNNRLNSPVKDYASDARVNSILYDPHASVYVSNTIKLSAPAKSLKVILSAYRHSSADFRVLYSLIRPDSSEVSQSFELFPGYNNLIGDKNNDGFLDVVNPSQNNGLPDRFVPSSLEDEFLEYEFSATDLGSFTGYTIKIVMSGTNQANPPKFKHLRSIALA